MHDKIRDIESLLDKMNRLFRNFRMSDNRVDKIDLDLMKDYTKQMYEYILEYESGKEISVKIQTEDAPTENRHEEKKVTQKSDDYYIQSEKKKTEEPIVEIAKIEPRDRKIPDQQKESTASPLVTKQEIKNKKPLSFADKEEGEEDPRTELHSKLSKDKKTLGDKIKTKPVFDLRNAIDLNDKFYFIKELFKGDHNAYDKSIRFINNLSTFEDARTYVEKELTAAYNWKSNADSVQRLLEAIKIKFG
ncbi:MAG: hypothetical protein H7X71_07150 [Chitinophagales bacterium]|nr:hypothetical protein [Chitinophagales bacterium]